MGKQTAADECPQCGGDGTWPDTLEPCPRCHGAGLIFSEVSEETDQDRRAWDEDEADMQRIADEWANYDRDPPGS